MKNVLLTLVMTACLSSFGFGQVHFKTVDWLGPVIVEGISYTATAYMYNDGPDTLIGEVNVYARAIFPFPLQDRKISENFMLPDTVFPGDSVLIDFPSMIFSVTHLTPGLNDIIIWPEAPAVGGASGSYSDYITSASTIQFIVPPVLSVTEGVDGLSFDVYPNPVKDVLHLSSNLDAYEFEMIQIFNPMGQLIRQENSLLSELDLSDLPTGMYKLKLVSRDLVGVKSFFKF